MKNSLGQHPIKKKPTLSQRTGSAQNLAQANKALKLHQQNLVLQRPVGIEYTEGVRILLKKMEFSKTSQQYRIEWTKYVPKEIERDNWLPKESENEGIVTYDGLINSEEGEEGAWDSLKAVVGKRHKPGPKGYQAIFDLQNEEKRLQEEREAAAQSAANIVITNQDNMSHGDDHSHGHSHSDSHANDDENDGRTDEEKMQQRKNELKKKYCNTSLGHFDLEDPVRLYAISIMENPWFDRSVIFLITVNSILLGVIDYTWVDDGQQTNIPLINKIVDQTEIIFTLFFTFECVVKILSMGLIVKSGCYLQDGWNWLDFTVVVTALMQAIPGMGNVSAVRTFRLFRPLRSLSAIPSMKLLVNTLLHSVSQLSNILILNTFFIFTFAIFGLQMWEGVMHYRCRQTEHPVDGDWKVVEDDNRICGAFHQCEIACGSLYELTIPNKDGILTEYFINKTIPLDRDSKSSEFNYGITNFDSIFPSFLTIFQCTTLEGWSEIMVMIQDGYNMYASAIFFVICVVICNYFLINLTVAVMLDKFKILNQENTDKALLKYEQNSHRVQVLKKMKAVDELKTKITWKDKLNTIYSEAIYSDPGEPPKVCNHIHDHENFEYAIQRCWYKLKKIPKRIDNVKYNYTICRFCWKLTKIPLFNSVIMTFITMNTLILATDKFPSPEVDLIIHTNVAFNIFFSLECVIKLTGLKFDEWIADEFNIFDLIIVIASIIEMFLVSQGQAGVISVLRAFRLIRLIKLARSNVTLRCLIDSIAATVKAIGNFMVILAIFIYVFSLLGMQMFAGRFRFNSEGYFDDENGQVPRTNFDGLLWSIITVFQIMVGDQWNQVMYKAYLAVSHNSVGYFIVLVLLGKIILLNLFLAILLGNFEQESLIIRASMEDQILEKFMKASMEYKANEPKLGQKVNMTSEIIISDKISDEIKQAQASQLVDGEFSPNNQPHSSDLIHLQKIPLSMDRGDGQNTHQADYQSQPHINMTGNVVIVNNVDVDELYDAKLKSYKDSSFDSSINFEERHSARNIKTIQSGNIFQRAQTQTHISDPNAEFNNQEITLQSPKDQNENQDQLHKSLQQEQMKQDLMEFQEQPDNLANLDTNRPMLLAQNNGTEPQHRLTLGIDPSLAPNDNCTFNQNPFGVAAEENIGSHRNINRPSIETKNLEILSQNNELSAGHLEDSQKEVIVKQKNKIFLYMSESSLLVFHRDSIIRKFMMKLTMAPITKKTSPKDILLSQIQNGGVEEDDTDDGEELDEQEQKIKGGADLLPLGKPIDSKKKKEKLQKQQNEQLESPGVTALMTNSVLEKTNDDKMKIEKQVEEKIEEEAANEQDQDQNQGDKKQLNDSTASAIEEIKRMKDGSLIKNVFQNLDTRKQNQFIKLTINYKKCKRKMFCWQWTLNNWFEYTIYFIIFLSMLLLIIQNPLNDPNGQLAQVFFQLDRTITYIFIFEAACRIIALGFINSSIPQRKAYIRVGGNQIDFFVCIGCDLILMYNNHNPDNVNLSQKTLKSFKVLRALKALRPLRIISKNQGLKLAVGSLFGALPAIANGMIVCLLIVFIYAIAGVNLFKGKFYSCVINDQDKYRELEPTIITKQDCLDADGHWMNSENNFDNIFNSAAVLFQIITTEGWLDVMYLGVDAVGIDKQPKQNNIPLLSIYFISFIIVGNIFVLNLFVGIVIDKFNRLKDRMCGYALMTRDQKEWIESEKQMIRLMLISKKNPPLDPKRLIAFEIAKHKYFEIFINVCILLSTIVLSLRFYKMSDEYNRMLEKISYFLTFIYNSEAVIKIAAFNMDYFTQNWNRFDFFIVVIADISILIKLVVSDGSSGVITIMTIIKAIRILRVFRLIRTSRKLRVLVDSLLVILPSIANVGSLMLLMFFIFAVIGMNMFSGIIHQTYINQNNNFMNFGMSLVILIRCATGENWNLIMKELAISKESFLLYNVVDENNSELGCVHSQTYESLIEDGPKECGTSLSYFYFALFIIVIQMMMLNLFIAVVLEGYASTNKMHQGAVKSDDYEVFIEKWVDYDNQATGWINVHDLIFLIYELKEPLGRLSEYESDIKDQLDMTENEKNDENIIDQSKRYVVNVEKNMIIPFKRALTLLSKIQLPVYGDHSGDHKCHFRDVCKRLTRLAFEKHNPNYDPAGVEYKHQKILSRAWIDKYPDLKTKKIKKHYDTGKLWASLFIASCIKNVVSQRRLKRQKLDTNTNNVKRDNFQMKKSSSKTQTGSQMSEVHSQINASQAKQSDMNEQNEDSISQANKKTPFYDKIKEEFAGRSVKIENQIEIIKHCDHAIKKLKKEKELQNIDLYEKQQIQYKDNIKTKMRSQLRDEQKKSKIEEERARARDQRGKSDNERSTWWMDNEEQNKKMRQWIDKQRETTHKQTQSQMLPKQQPTQENQ